MWTAVTLVAVLFIFPSVHCRSETASQVDERIETLQPELDRHRIKDQQIQAQLNRVEDELTRFISNLKSTEIEVARLKSEQVETNDALEKADESLSEIENTLKDAEQELESRRHILTDRLQRIYKRNRIEEIGLLLKSESMSSFTLRYKLLKRLIKDDVKLFKEIEKSLVLVKEKREQKKLRRQEIMYLKEKRTSELESLEKKKAEVYLLKKRIETKKEVLITRAEENRKAAGELVEMLQKLKEEKDRLLEEARKKKVVITEKRRKKVDRLEWPIGNINMVVSPFGQGVDPAFGTPRFNAGIDLHASPGQPVLAAAEGIVLYKGRMTGYGKFVIVEHGSDLATVYAKLDDFMVRINQEVKTGDEIGVTSDQAFHFEVRKGTNCVNPLKWLR